MSFGVKNMRIQGFKSLRDIDLDLGSLNVFIGANGSGKSNLIGVFTLLNRIVEQGLQEYIGRVGGAETILFMGSKQTPAIELSFSFGENGYHCQLLATLKDSLSITEQCLYYGYGLDKRPFDVQLAQSQTESTMVDVARMGKERVVKYVLPAMQSWVVYHFHDTSDSALVKKTHNINDNVHLYPDARNLAAYLYLLRERSSDSYANIRDTIRMVAPFFDDFVLRPAAESTGTIRLEWRQKGTDMYMDASSLSDGTLRFMCLATLLLQPGLPQTILLDEPELGLHPYAINVLGGLLRSASTRAQVIVATQSVTLVDQFELGDIIVTDRKDQESTFTRPDAAALASWLEDYSLGELWEKNLLGGRP
jgi:predicted ATPase